MRGSVKTLIASAVVLFSLLSGLQAAATAPALEDKAIEDIIKKVSPSVVRVEARNGIRKVATGVVIDANGHIVTTALITPGEEKIFVMTTGGRRIDAKFLGYDSETHLAVLEAKDKDLPALQVARGTELSPGTWIGVVSMSPENKPAVSQGIVSSVAEDILRLNVWVVGGASGSPVVNDKGQMVGLLRGVYSEDQPLIFEFRETQAVGSGVVLSKAEAPSSGMAQAIPADTVLLVAESIRDTGKVQRGWLGVEMAENEDGRVEIISVDADSPASLVKLLEGDILLKIDGKDVTGGAMLSSEIRRRKPGQDVNLTVQRDGKEMNVKVKLGERPEEENRRELEMLYPRLFPAPKEPPTPPAPKSLIPDKKSPLTKEKVAPWPPGVYGLTRLANRKFIGVTLEEKNRELSEFFGLKEGTGLLVGGLDENGPAAKAGLKIGDLIFKADGKRVETIDELSGMIQDMKKGDKLKIEFLRSKKEMSVEVEISQEETESLFPESSGEALKMWRENFNLPEGEFNKLIEEMQSKNKDLISKYRGDYRRLARIYSGGRAIFRI